MSKRALRLPIQIACAAVLLVGTVYGATVGRAEPSRVRGSGPHVSSSAWGLCDEVCCHVTGSRYECPDSTMGYRMFQTPGEITSATLMITTAKRQTVVINLPKGTDALFLTPNAVESFLLRHYEATDRTKAAEIREFLTRTRRPNR